MHIFTVDKDHNINIHVQKYVINELLRWRIKMYNDMDLGKTIICVENTSK